jgi:predicted outer membrane protein
MSKSIVLVLCAALLALALALVLACGVEADPHEARRACQADPTCHSLEVQRD